MGDLNASPDAGVIRPELATTFAGFTDKGFREPWAQPSRTWCPPPANPLASGRDEKWYDHILLNGCGTRATTLTTSLSDHFGLMVELGPHGHAVPRRAVTEGRRRNPSREVPKSSRTRLFAVSALRRNTASRHVSVSVLVVGLALGRLPDLGVLGLNHRSELMTERERELRRAD